MKVWVQPIVMEDYLRNALVYEFEVLWSKEENDDVIETRERERERREMSSPSPVVIPDQQHVLQN